MSVSDATTARSAAEVVFRHAPSLAGGPLSLLNGALACLAEARRRGPEARAVLELDECLLRPLDRKLLLLDAQGNPVRLAGPENGRFDVNGRRALAAAAVNAMPPTADVEAVVERLLPAAGQDPLEAEASLWRNLLEDEGLEVRVRRAGGAALPPPPWTAPEVTWFGPRHLQALRQFDVAPELALQGEAALRQALTPPPPERLQRQLEQLEGESESRLAELEAAILAEEPKLFGAWCQLRREHRRGLSGFRRRVERSLRNRDGIRGSRLRALAQGLRPLDGPQQDGLGLMAAAALFQLDLNHLGCAIPAWIRAANQEHLLVETVSGALIP